MYTGLCHETRQRQPAHPDKLFLDMTGLVQLLQRRLHCTALRQKPGSVKMVFSHVTQPSQFLQKLEHLTAKRVSLTFIYAAA